MIYVVTPEKRKFYTDLLTDMHRARHKLYVEGRKWRELAKADGLEKDQFDHDKAVYFLALGKNRQLQGGLRLIPTDSPNMLKDIFPELCTKIDVPNTSSTWEMSRVFVNHHDTCDENGLLIKGKLMCAMFEFVQENSINEIVGVTDSYFLPRLLALDINVMPLGIPKPYDSGEMVAISIKVDESTLAKAQHNYKIPYRVLVDEMSKELPLIASLMQPREFSVDESTQNRISLREEYLYELISLVHELGSGDVSRMRRAEEALDHLILKAEADKDILDGLKVPSMQYLQ